VALICGVFGGYIGKTCEKFVKCFTTAFVGAFLFAYGLAFYLNNYPSLDVNKDELDPWIYLYFGTQILLTVLGTWFQIYLFRD
jgi:hypothetical protein